MPKFFGEFLRRNFVAKNVKRPYRDYEEDLVEQLKNPVFASEYLKVALEEVNQPAVFMTALSRVAKAKGIRQIKTKLNRESLYKLLSAQGNPTLASLHSILDFLGLRLSIETKKKAA
jgi:probable addiction module antidote protein